MPPAALALIVVAAFTHASWNLLAKRAAECRHFVWFYSAGTVFLWMPLVLAYVLLARPVIGLPEGGAFAVTALLHAAYSILLQRGYRAADLSVVYPVARGTGPLIAFIGAVLVLGERPTALATAGAALVVGGVFWLAGGPAVLRASRQRAGLAYGVAIGTCIAAYTVWDGWAVKVLLIAPLLLDYAGNCLRLLLLTPRALSARTELLPQYRRYWKEALGVSILGPLGYILVLHAMRLAPVSHVAPARELSMMIGAYFGARLLREGALRRRIAASAVIVCGVVGLALG